MNLKINKNLASHQIIKHFVAPALLFSAAVAVSFGYPMKVSNIGKTIGTAEYSQKVSGGKVTKYLSIKTTNHGKTSVVSDTTVYNSAGTPLSDSFFTQFGANSVHLAITYTSTAAIVHGTFNGKSISRKVLLPKGASMANPSNVWFITRKPSANQIIVATVFDTQNLQWVNHTVSYRGDQTITIDGKSVLSHRLYDQENGGDQELWLNSSGQLLRYASNGILIQK